MAFSRLFGKSKKDPPSPSGSNHSPDLSEREGDDNFTVVENKPNSDPHNDHPPNYNSLSQLPYAISNIGSRSSTSSSGQPGAKPSLQSQISHPLEGVIFHLSPKLATDAELDQMGMTVDSVLSRLKNIEWSAFEYNFTLEQSVLSSELDIDGVKIN